MRRVIVIAAAGFSLAGCSSFSSSSMGDYFKSTPPTVQVQLDSTPQGADARTSLGPGCKTPCSVSVPAPENGGFSVTYTLNKFQPTTVPVTVVHNPGEFLSAGTTNFNPNPVVAELQPAGPPPRAPRKHSIRPRKPKPPPQGDAAAPPPPADSAFPAPATAAPPPPPPRQ
jgi:hypothetical protein